MDSQKSGQTDRRDFFRKALAVIIGGIAGIVPAIAGLRTFLDPLKHKSDVAPSGVPLIQVTTLDALPNDGVPRKFPVLANKTDAWNKYVNVPIGAVYLRRTPDDKVE